jgi:hypothetical protein
MLAGASGLALATAAQAAAYGPQQQLPANVMSEFKNTPAQLLLQFPTGGGQMIARIRDLIASDPDTLKALLALLPSANKDQKAAMGAALAQAARLYLRVDQAVANQIQQAVATSNDPDLILAYTAAAGEQPIGGVGGGAGGSAGGVGGQTNSLGGPTGNGTGIQNIGGDGTATGVFSYTSATSAAAGTSTSTTTTSTTVVSGP